MPWWPEIPDPVTNLRHVLAVTNDVALVIDEFFTDRLLRVCGAPAKARHAVDDIGYQMKTIEIVQHNHVEGRRGSALLLVTADVEVVMVGPSIREAMNKQGVSVIREDDRFVRCEQHVELAVAQPVRVLARRLKLHEIDDVDDAYL